MNQVSLFYKSGYRFQASVVKYFTYKFNTYFIYTINEVDDRGFVKLYIVKVLDEFGNKVCQTIRRNDEWDKIKMIVKRLIDEIRAEKIVEFSIHDPHELNNMTIFESREFKLSSDLVNLLTQNVIAKQETDVLESLMNESYVDDLNIENNNVENISSIIEYNKEEQNMDININNKDNDQDIFDEEGIEVLEL